MIIKASLPIITLSFSLKDKLISLMRLTLRLFHRIKIFNLMRSHQTFRTYKFTNITFLNKIWSRYFIWKSNMRKARQKKNACRGQDINDGVFINEEEKKLSTEKAMAWEIFLFYYSLSFVVTRCTTRCHLMYHSPVFL